MSVGDVHVDAADQEIYEAGEGGRPVHPLWVVVLEQLHQGVEGGLGPEHFALVGGEDPSEGVTDVGQTLPGS